MHECPLQEKNLQQYNYFMKIWITQDGEPIPGIDKDTREWRTAILSKALVSAGHEVLWWASTFDHARKKHWFNEPKTIEVMPGLNMRLLHSSGYKSSKSLKRFWHHRELADQFIKEAEDESVRPDLIYASLPTLELAEKAVIYGNSYNIPVVVDVRDLWPDIYLTIFPVLLKHFAKLVFYSEFRRANRMFQSATAILAVSNTYFRWALKYAKRSESKSDKIFPLGYKSLQHSYSTTEEDELKSKFGIRRNCMVVTFVGIFGFSYDLETVVHAAKVIEEQGKYPIQFVIVGDGDQKDKLQKLANGISTIVLTGWLDNESVEKLIGLSSICLAAYSDHATQTLPNKPFEYMAAGLPLLSSLKGELEYLITEERIGLQYKAGDINSLVQQIVWLYENPNERKEMGMRAKRLFDERFDADVIYPNLVEHLEAVVEGVKRESGRRERMQSDEQ